MTLIARRNATEYGTTEMLRVDALRVDHKYQRGIDQKRAEKIATAFDAAKLGIVHVSRRANGILAIIDGQHRVAAMLALNMGDGFIEAKVYEGLTLAEEASLFDGLNTAQKPMPLDTFKARVVAGDRTAVNIRNILADAGWRVGYGTSPGLLSAIAKAERVYSAWGGKDQSRGPETFAKTISILTSAWGHEPLAVQGDILQALGLVLLRYGDAVDVPALVKKLAQYPGGPAKFIGQARGIRGYRGGTMPHCTAELIVDMYNKGRRQGALPAWRGAK